MGAVYTYGINKPPTRSMGNGTSERLKKTLTGPRQRASKPGVPNRGPSCPPGGHGILRGATAIKSNLGGHRRLKGGHNTICKFTI